MLIMVAMGTHNINRVEINIRFITSCELFQRDRSIFKMFGGTLAVGT